MMTGEEFVAYVADRLAALPGIVAVALGGSRAQGTHRPGSDWDFALYYRSHFDPADLRGIGWAGEVSEIGAWGGCSTAVPGRRSTTGASMCTIVIPTSSNTNSPKPNINCSIGNR